MILELKQPPVVAPGVYALPVEVYDADPCPDPSLTQSICKYLLGASPRHAWWNHVRLNPARVEKDARRFELGTVAHTLLVGQGRKVEIIEANDYRTKIAQALRDEAFAAGRMPIVRPDYDAAVGMVVAARAQLANIPGAGQWFVDGAGLGEVTLAWRDLSCGVWCRSRVDWIPGDSGARVIDYKTTARAAKPEGLGRLVVDMGYDVQAAFIERGLETLDPDLGGRTEAIFVFQEVDPPYMLSAVSLDAEALDVGRRKAAAAIELWARCVNENTWPGYEARVTSITYPSWALAQWMDREARDHFAKQDGDPFSLLNPLAPGGAQLE